MDLTLENGNPTIAGCTDMVAMDAQSVKEKNNFNIIIL